MRYGIARPDKFGSPPPARTSEPWMRPAASGALAAKTRVRNVKSGPSRVSASAVVNSLVFDAGTKKRSGFNS